MSWHFSQALVAASSGERSSGGEPSAPSSLTPTPAMCWWPGRTTDAFRPSRSGMTCEPLTADRGAELLTWCLAGSPARTSPPPARAPGSAAPVLDSGERWHALLVKFDPASCGWKTARCLWEEGLDWSCLTLPRWGSLHDGELWERATPGLPTSETASGFWPTPRASEAGPDFAKLTRSKTGISLQTAVAMWPTPRAANPGSRPNGKGGKILAEEVAIAEGLRERGRPARSYLIPTPTAHPEAPNHGSNSNGPHNLLEVAQTGWNPGMMWPTPTSTLGTNGGLVTPAKAREGGTLIEALSARTLWPTPTASDNRPRGTQNSTARRMALGKQVGLEAMVKWATPTAHNAKEAACPAEYLRATPTLAAQAGGSLNPTWVEWLMGWPLGWTDSAQSATARFRQWLDSHGRR